MKATAFLLLIMLNLAWASPPVQAQEKATAQEVLQKVREARDFLLSAGRAGIAEFNDKRGRWVWKDTYVFVVEMENVTVIGHPVNPRLLGKTQIGLKDIRGNFFFIQFCEKAREPGGGWVEYWWPRPGEREPARKVSYVMQVPGTSLMLGSGVYDEEVTLEQLNRLIRD